VSLLFLAHRAPFAPDRGDRIRSHHILRHLASRMPVHLVTFAGEAGEAVPDLGLASCTAVPRLRSRSRALADALVTRRPVSLTAFAEPAFAAAVTGVMERHRPDRAFVFSGQMAQHVPAGLRFVMDFCDVDSAKFAAMGGVLAPLYRREARLLATYEREVAMRAEAAVFVSAAEAALFGAHGRVEVVENGVDTAFWCPAAAPADTPEIVFTGQMDYAPNVEAVRWFAATVLPRVREVHPAAQFAIVGRAPGAAVRALASRPGVVVTDAVADVRPWLRGAAVAVAPLRIARGVQNKVLEAMATARPVVATPDAAQGIAHGNTVSVADDAPRFAAAVSALIADRAAGDRQGAAARRQVERRYGWDAALRPLDALLEPSARAAA